MISTSLLLALTVTGAALASARIPIRRADDRNDGIHLAVRPNCGALSGRVSDVNAGLLPLSSYQTIVAFGDSYTDGGIRNGSALLPPVLIPPSTFAGGRTTNGPVWAEDLANDVGARLMDYAFGGAVTNASLWPSKANNSDFISQMNVFLPQQNNLDPDTTLYTAFFGINDYFASLTDGDHLPEAAATIIEELTILISPPTNARHIMVLDDYGRGNETVNGDAFKQSVFSRLHALHTRHGVNVGYVDFKTIWNGVLNGPPGFEAFGYTSSDSCLPTENSLVGECSDPEHFFYWIPEHPSKETHRIMADYIEDVLTEC